MSEIYFYLGAFILVYNQWILKGKGVEEWKLAPMIGMFHDRGQSSQFLKNIAAGSERAAFSGSGFECGDNTSFVGNVAHSSLAGYW
jgi:hypothetical protein